ncbi:hypothetical protein ACMFMG_000713 [Clarireedia jacksonii]
MSFFRHAHAVRSIAFFIEWKGEERVCGMEYGRCFVVLSRLVIYIQWLAIARYIADAKCNCAREREARQCECVVGRCYVEEFVNESICLFVFMPYECAHAQVGLRMEKQKERKRVK